MKWRKFLDANLKAIMICKLSKQRVYHASNAVFIENDALERVHWDGDEENFFKHALDVEKKLLEHVFPFFCYGNLKEGEIPNLSEFEKAPRGSEKEKIKKAPESISLGCY